MDSEYSRFRYVKDWPDRNIETSRGIIGAGRVSPLSLEVEFPFNVFFDNYLLISIDGADS